MNYNQPPFGCYCHFSFSLSLDELVFEIVSTDDIFVFANCIIKVVKMRNLIKADKKKTYYVDSFWISMT